MQQICVPVETVLAEALTTDSTTESGHQSTPGRCAHTRGVWTACLTCWSPQVFLPVLGPRLLRLCLQLCRRYAVWAEERFKSQDDGTETPVGKTLTLIAGELNAFAEAVEDRLLPIAVSAVSKQFLVASQRQAAASATTAALQAAAADIKSLLPQLQKALLSKV